MAAKRKQPLTILLDTEDNEFPRKQPRNEENAEEAQIVVEEWFLCHWYGCTYAYDSRAFLQAHVEESHIERKPSRMTPKYEFICMWNGCERQRDPFNENYQLLAHVRGHTGFKPFVCNYPNCNKTYGRVENLKSHIRSKHTLERPYDCGFEQCSKAFSNASDRHKHRTRVHGGEKPYSCPELDCNKAYTDQSSLRKHISDKHGADCYQLWKDCRAEQRFYRRRFDFPGQVENFVIDVNDERSPPEAASEDDNVDLHSDEVIDVISIQEEIVHNHKQY